MGIGDDHVAEGERGRSLTDSPVINIDTLGGNAR